MSLVSLTLQIPSERFMALLGESPEFDVAPMLNTAVTPSQPAMAQSILDPAKLPRLALNKSGNRVAAGAVEHVVTHLPTVGLMFDVRKPQTVSSLAKAQEIAAQCDLLDRKGSWVVGEDYETQLIVDRNFHEPAVDKHAFPNMPDSGLIYTNRKTAWSPDLVWFVTLTDGDVNWSGDGLEGLVVPVLRVPVSQ